MDPKDDESTEEAPTNERFAERFGRGRWAAPASEKPLWWPACYHSRWTRLDRKKFKDRIVWLKECRKCGKKKSEIVYLDLNSRKVYTARDSFDIRHVESEIKDGE